MNWTQGTAPVGDVRSLVLDPTSPPAARGLYAGVRGVGVVQSTDGGRNWTTILNAVTPAVAASLAAGGFTSISKVVVALAPPTAPANPAGIQVLYATMVGTGVTFGAADAIGVFQSTDQGANWTTRATTAVLATIGTTYGGYCLHMAVDPASPGDGAGDVIYVGTLGQGRSTDAGSTFVALSGLHADSHTWAFAPQPGPLSVVYSGNDGGIFRCTAGTNFASLNGGGFQAALFYNLDVTPDATASVTLGALQDNGIVTTAGAIAPTWIRGAGGDGFDVAHDGVLPTQVYGRSNANILRSTDDGGSYGGITPPWLPAESDVYLAAVATDPGAGGTVYASGNQNLWQSTDGGATWPNSVPISGIATEVDVAPNNGNNVVVAIGGRVFVSTDALVPGGLTLTDITRNLPGRFVGGVAFDPNDPATIYAVLGGFSGAPGGHVFRTSLTAAGWTDISPPLDLPFNAIALDGSDTPTALYTGTDFGVLRSVDGGANWSVLDDIHFPGAPVFELVCHRGELRAATFGRGVFSFVRPTGPSIAVNLENDLQFGTACPGPGYLTLEIFNVGVSDLVITSVQRLMGSTAFSVLATPLTPLVIARGRTRQLHRAVRSNGRGVPDRDHPHPEQRPDGAGGRLVRDRVAGYSAADHGDRRPGPLRQRLPAELRRQGPAPQQQRHLSAARDEHLVLVGGIRSPGRPVLSAAARGRRRPRSAGPIPSLELRCQGGHAQHREHRPGGTADGGRLGHGPAARTRPGDSRQGQLRQGLCRRVQGPAADPDQQRRVRPHRDGHHLVRQRIRRAGCDGVPDPAGAGHRGGHANPSRALELRREVGHHHGDQR